MTTLTDQRPAKLAGNPALRADTARPAGLAETHARVWGWVAAAGSLAALAAMVYAHLLPDTGVSPLTAPVSDYALSGEGRAAIMAGTLMLAMGCLWSVYGMAQTDPARTAATRVLLTAASLGLVLTAIFPADPVPGFASTGGELHRWAAALVFTGIPCAAWMLARDRPAHPRWILLKATAVISILVLAAFLAAHPSSPTSDLIGGAAYHGLLQRLLLLSDIALLLMTALAVPLTVTARDGRAGTLRRLP
jgi:hypothetical protein